MMQLSHHRVHAKVIITTMTIITIINDTTLWVPGKDVIAYYVNSCVGLHCNPALLLRLPCYQHD